MRRIYCFAALLATAVAVALLLAPARVSAITYGFVDGDNSYPNVGAFIVLRPDGQIFPICSGTLIAPSVFLTASHCTVFYTDRLAPLGFSAFVSFDNPIPFGGLTSRKTRLIPVEQVVTNPNFTQAQNDSGDIAVLILPQRSTRGIVPATLPTAGLLDELFAQGTLQDSIFANVGYGVQNRVVGGGPPFFEDLNPIPRMFSFSSFNALNGGYMRLSQNPATDNGGTCFGDSGGPQFLDVNGIRTIVSVTVTGDSVCRSTNVVYRVDTSSAREFLAPFVALP